MRPGLYIFKRRISKAIGKYSDCGDPSAGSKTEIHFAVVDLDVGKSYPINYVCILPQVVDLAKTCTFTRIFEEESIELAKRLLNQSLSESADKDISAAIKKRLAVYERQLIGEHVNILKA